MNIKNISFSVLGTFLIAMAISLVYLQDGTAGYNFGAGPWDAFNGDMVAVTGIPVNMVLFLEGLFFVTILSISLRAKFSWVALMTGALVGLFIGILTPLVSSIDANSTFDNFIIFSSYVLLITAGIAFCIESSFFISPIEKSATDFYYDTNVKHKVNYKLYRSLYESIPIWCCVGLIVISPSLTLSTSSLTIFTILLFVIMGPLIAMQRKWVQTIVTKEN